MLLLSYYTDDSDLILSECSIRVSVYLTSKGDESDDADILGVHWGIRLQFSSTSRTATLSAQKRFVTMSSDNRAQVGRLAKLRRSDDQ